MNTQIGENLNKEIFSAKIVAFDLQNGNWGHIVMLNSEQAANYWIKDDDKISLIRKNEEFVVDDSDYSASNYETAEISSGETNV